jgi:hypothetical protein
LGILLKYQADALGAQWRLWRQHLSRKADVFSERTVENDRQYRHVGAQGEPEI